MDVQSLKLENVGQIREADVRFGDLTVFVGPQATGKSIFLEFLKLVIDARPIHTELKRYGADWGKEQGQFLDLYLGEGMKGVWSAARSVLSVNGLPMDLEKLAIPRSGPSQKESVFLVPAQRVLTLRDGWPRPFSDYGPGDPFTVRYFSERLRRLMESDLAKEDLVFPGTRRLKNDIRDLVAAHVFGSFDLKIDRHRAQKRLVLGSRKGRSVLPFMVWSAGQREFVPLLLGLYWLLPRTKVSRRENLRWVVIEELEMGLHPRAIAVVLLLVLELLSRGYRVCLSTHSTHVLDLVWALRTLREHSAHARDLLEIMQANTTPQMLSMATAALAKETRVYYFERESGKVVDISRLDPDAEEISESGWGGIGEFSGRVVDVISRVINSSVDRTPQ